MSLLTGHYEDSVPVKASPSNGAHLNQAKKDYYNAINYLRQAGVNVDVPMATKIKADIIANQSIKEF